jgi:uncharacterized protein (DUF934 family)
MATLIKERRIVADSWQLLEAEPWLRVGENGLVPDFPQDADLLVTLRLWQLRREDLIERRGRVGLLLEAWNEPDGLAPDLPCFALLAVRVAKFGDGRANSLARLLRERHDYEGEIRAIGDVLPDHLHFMAQCGFDAFALREDQDPEEALAAFDDFSDGYQASVAQPAPLFRRRLAATQA